MASDFMKFHTKGSNRKKDPKKANPPEADCKYRISNKKFRIMKYGIASLSLFPRIIMIEHLTSTSAFLVLNCAIFRQQ